MPETALRPLRRNGDHAGGRKSIIYSMEEDRKNNLIRVIREYNEETARIKAIKPRSDNGKVIIK